MTNNNLLLANDGQKKWWVYIVSSFGIWILCNSVVMAQCRLDSGVVDAKIKLATRYNPSQTTSSFIFSCSANTEISAVSVQPNNWKDFTDKISMSQQDKNGVNLPASKINAIFYARLVRNDGIGGTLKEWKFNMTQPMILIEGNTAAYRLEKGVKYKIVVDRIDGRVTPHTNVFKSLPTVRAMGSYLNINGLYPMARGETENLPPVTTPSCMPSAFIVTVPPVVEFKSMGQQELSAGKEFIAPFAIEVSRKSSVICKPTTIPSVTFESEGVVGKEYVPIPKLGLLFSISRVNPRQVLTFGTAYELPKQVEHKSVIERYEGHIIQDPTAKVKSGAFSVTVTWKMSYK